MEQLLLFLDSIAPLSQELKGHLTSILKFRTLAKNDFLLKPGQYGDKISFLLKGLVRCYYDKEGKEITRWLLKEGDVVVSLNSFYTGKPSTEYIQSLEETTIGYITKTELDNIFEKYAEFNWHGRILSTKYQLYWDDIIYATVMKTAEERYFWLISNYPELIQRVAGKHLASYLGMDVTTFSKIKSTFKT